MVLGREMAITKEKKQEIIGTFGRAEVDTGSPEVQVALLTARINDLAITAADQVADNDDPLGCGAGLAGIAHPAGDGPFHGSGEVVAVQHDEGVRSAELTAVVIRRHHPQIGSSWRKLRTPRRPL